MYCEHAWAVIEIGDQGRRYVFFAPPLWRYIVCRCRRPSTMRRASRMPSRNIMTRDAISLSMVQTGDRIRQLLLMPPMPT